MSDDAEEPMDYSPIANHNTRALLAEGAKLQAEIKRSREEVERLRNQLTIAVAWCEKERLTPFWATVARRLISRTGSEPASLRPYGADDLPSAAPCTG